MASLSPVLCPILSAATQSDHPVTHGFFTRQGGISTGIYSSLNIGPGSQDNGDHVSANRRAIAQHLEMPCQDVVSVWQTHSSDAVIATKHWGDDRPKADALVTNVPDLPIAIVTADCGPVLFCDPQNKVIGAAHAGWRGATGNVLEATVEKMIELGATREHILATLGPTISSKNYEVGPEFVEKLISDDADHSRFFSRHSDNGHAYFDLPAFILARLDAVGVKGSWTGHCTYEDEQRFFSYRRTTHRSEPDYGRQMSAIAIRKSS